MQAIWTLGNIADSAPEHRDSVLSHGALQPILACMGEDQTISMLRTGAGTLCTICHTKPPPAFEAVSSRPVPPCATVMQICVRVIASSINPRWYVKMAPALPTLARMVSSNDEEVLTDAAWALSYLSDGSNDDGIQKVIDAGVCPRVVELLS